ncbi:MAG: hypothetical protein IIT48_07440, partial [Lachnospiraceae bacterium]|nr:hypothetical protein [Lachnospiraceae bacterium]
HLSFIQTIFYPHILISFSFIYFVNVPPLPTLFVSSFLTTTSSTGVPVIAAPPPATEAVGPLYSTVLFSV